jgi:hypothetical protein
MKEIIAVSTLVSVLGFLTLLSSSSDELYTIGKIAGVAGAGVALVFGCGVAFNKVCVSVLGK